MFKMVVVVFFILSFLKFKLKTFCNNFFSYRTEYIVNFAKLIKVKFIFKKKNL